MNYYTDIILYNTVDVTDPCYSKDTWCRINDLPVLPGTYRCYYSTMQDMIAECMIVNTDNYPYEDTLPNDYWEYIGEIGVDAGLAGFFENKPDYNNADEWFAFCDMLENKDCFAGDNYFLTSSGYGDGGYDVFGIKDAHTGRYKALKIMFIEEEPDDDEEYL